MGKYARLAKHFASRRIDSVQFVAYDFNVLGTTSHALNTDLPNMHLSPAFQRTDNQFKKYFGEPTLDDMASYIKKHADVKFQMKTRNLDPQAGQSMEELQAQVIEQY